MTKQELIDRVYAKYGKPANLTKKAVGDIIGGVFEELSDYFVKEKVTKKLTPRFTFPGFGTFTKKHREARKGRHPQTGAEITIGATDTLTFSIGSDLKATMNERSS
ncbi:HU family DNA-binding protein [Haliangium ochraceum]|uniref:Histone family protein DNA-binding protein n=1 Tax=Haliangium ochraceum (strain DSM 14365 / JCM 11303 / SMP-2) TaxID=502025 RepID=D0LVE2_HALO1|nr:HU family DNA-binding protein [Haliangium ochraceum]ACY17503.1 histone family protein DNA-binding protein [Haliangium ochraceum DSM 14365]